MIGTLLVCATLLAVDGDTIKCDGVNMRDMGDGSPFVSGYDTPEIGATAQCPEERALGKQAKARMSDLLQTPGLQIYESGEHDGRYRRPLVWVRLPDGRSISSVLMAEGLAAEWAPGYVPAWCDGYARAAKR